MGVALIRLHPKDNVLIAREPLTLGAQVNVDGVSLKVRAQVPAGHKIAARKITANEIVLKYDTPIGVATRDIEPGEHVHSHNIALAEFHHQPDFGRDVVPVQYVPLEQRATFMGIVRADGRVATRNFIGIMSSVNCSSTAIRRIADWFTPERLADYPNVDGVVAFAQTTGGGMSTPS